LLLLDPWILGDLVGGSVHPQQRETQGDIAGLDLRLLGQGLLLDLDAVDIDAVEAALVLDDEGPALVKQASVGLGDRGLRKGQVVAAGATDRVGPGLQEVDLLRQVPADHLQEGHGHAGPAMRAAVGVRGVESIALRALHGLG
jgi:hypothetical protein